jgi:ketosteroid isomerase-like protein
MTVEGQVAAQAAGVAERFAGALLAGDASAAADFFMPGGICLSRDGTEVRGRAQIGALLAQLTGSEHQLTIRLGRTVVGDGAALSTQIWTRGSKPRRRAEGFEETSRARLVLGWRPGGWAILILDAWG